MIEKLKNFDAKNERNKRISYYVLYTIIFLLMLPVVYLQFGIEGRGGVWFDDALYQHFPALTYYAKILRATVAGIFTGGGLQLPLWDFAIGPGADIITTLNYYGVGDPLALLAACFPLHKMELGYTFLILFRMYLSGVTFSMFCKETRRGRFATLCGALAYVFCGFAIYAGARHPFFLNPMIIFPLLIMGIEKVLKNKKTYVCILAVFYAAVIGPYFFYMMGILAAIYVLVRGWSFFRSGKIKEWFAHLGKLVGSVVVGILLSGVIFIPNIIALLNSTRMRTETFADEFYRPDYYLQAPIHFLSNNLLGSWTVLGYAAVVAVAIFMMFSYRRKYTQLKIGFVILTIMLCIPYVGYIMNGFSYVANRWIWGYSFLVAFILATMLPKIIKIDVKRFRALLIVAGIYISYLCWFLVDEGTSTRIREVTKMSLIQYLMVLGVIIVAFVWKRRDMLIKTALLLTIVISVFMQVNWLFSPQGKGYVADFIERDSAFNRYTEVPSAVSAVEDRGEFYRYSENAYDTKYLVNGSLVAQLHSNSLYYSLVDENYLEYLGEIENNDIVDSGRIKGLDLRTGLETLASTKYVVTETYRENYVPYGYEKLFENGRFSVYKNEHYLPLGYTYQGYIPRVECEKLNAAQREQAMLQAVVLDENATNLAQIEPNLIGQEVVFEVKTEKGATFTDGKFVIKKKEAQVVIEFEGMPNSETYLAIENLKYQATKGKSLARAIINLRDDREDGSEVAKKIDIRNPHYKWYVERHNFTVNMGYALQPKNKLTLNFSEKGEYTFDDINIIVQPMDNYVEQAGKLKEDVLENVVVGTNKVNGTIDLKDDKFLCVSIPYSKGWSVYVNGEKRELLRANTAYMGIELEAGHHEVEFRYFTPYLKMSIVCTMIGMILFVGIIVLGKRKKRT